jgi:hypothetical protein
MEKYFEIFFNIAYLIVIWILVIKMNNRKRLLMPKYRREGILILSATKSMTGYPSSLSSSKR